MTEGLESLSEDGQSRRLCPRTALVKMTTDLIELVTCQRQGAQFELLSSLDHDEQDVVGQLSNAALGSQRHAGTARDERPASRKVTGLEVAMLRRGG